ncbi:MAG: hypothetical protein ABSA46_18765 [Thermodesulfovibrionales bacterium]|jgi:hypothetical protein
MPLIRKRRIWWEPVTGISSYVVYAGAEQSAFAPKNFMWEATEGIVWKVVAEKNEVLIPDEWPEFPNGVGTYYIGITSKDDAGNQSDPFVSSGTFKFVPPPAPEKGGIEIL